MSGQEASSGSPQRSAMQAVDELRTEFHEVISGKPMNEASREASVFGRMKQAETDIEGHETRIEALESTNTKRTDQEGANRRSLWLGAVGTALAGVIGWIILRVLGS